MIHHAPYRDIEGPDGHLARCREFNGSSLHGRWVAGRYHVLSYGTVIGVWSPGTRTVDLDVGRHRRTTTRHQRAVSDWLASGRRRHVAEHRDGLGDRTRCPLCGGVGDPDTDGNVCDACYVDRSKAWALYHAGQAPRPDPARHYCPDCGDDLGPIAEVDGPRRDHDCDLAIFTPAG